MCIRRLIYLILSYGDEPEWFEYKQGTAVSKPDEVGGRNGLAR